MTVDRAHGLPSGMAYLRPEMIAVAGCRMCPKLEGCHHIGVRISIKKDVAGAFEMVRINMNIARNMQAGAAIRPNAIEALQFRCRTTQWIGKSFGHRGLCDAIIQHGPARQCQCVV